MISSGFRWLSAACLVFLVLVPAFGQPVDDSSQPVQMFKPEPAASDAANDELIEIEQGPESEPVGMEQPAAPVAEQEPVVEEGAVEPAVPEPSAPEAATEMPAETMPEPVEDRFAVEPAEPEAGALPEPVELKEPDIVTPAASAEPVVEPTAEEPPKPSVAEMPAAEPDEIVSEPAEPAAEAPQVEAEPPSGDVPAPVEEAPAAEPAAEVLPMPAEAEEPAVAEPAVTEDIAPEPAAEAPVEEIAAPEPAAEPPRAEVVEPVEPGAEVEPAAGPVIESSPLVDWTVFKLTCGQCGHVWEESSDHPDCDKPGNCPKCGAVSPAFEKVRAERRAPCPACAKDPDWCKEGRPRPL